MPPKRHTLTVTWSIPTDNGVINRRKRSMAYVTNPAKVGSQYPYPGIAIHILGDGSDDDDDDEDLVILKKRKRPVVVDAEQERDSEGFAVPTAPPKRLKKVGSGAVTTVSLPGNLGPEGSAESVVTSVSGRPVVGNAPVLPDQVPLGYEQAYERQMEHIEEASRDGGSAPRTISQGQTFGEGVAALRSRGARANEMNFYYPLGGPMRTIKLQDSSVFESLFPFGLVYPAYPVKDKKNQYQADFTKEIKDDEENNGMRTILSYMLADPPVHRFAVYPGLVIKRLDEHGRLKDEPVRLRITDFRGFMQAIQQSGYRGVPWRLKIEQLADNQVSRKMIPIKKESDFRSLYIDSLEMSWSNPVVYLPDIPEGRTSITELPVPHDSAGVYSTADVNRIADTVEDEDGLIDDSAVNADWEPFVQSILVEKFPPEILDRSTAGATLDEMEKQLGDLMAQSAAGAPVTVGQLQALMGRLGDVRREMNEIEDRRQQAMRDIAEEEAAEQQGLTVEWMEQQRARTEQRMSRVRERPMTKEEIWAELVAPQIKSGATSTRQAFVDIPEDVLEEFLALRYDWAGALESAEKGLSNAEAAKKRAKGGSGAFVKAANAETRYQTAKQILQGAPDARDENALLMELFQALGKHKEVINKVWPKYSRDDLTRFFNSALTHPDLMPQLQIVGSELVEYRRKKGTATGFSKNFMSFVKDAVDEILVQMDPPDISVTEQEDLAAAEEEETMETKRLTKARTRMKTTTKARLGGQRRDPSIVMCTFVSRFAKDVTSLNNEEDPLKPFSFEIGIPRTGKTAWSDIRLITPEEPDGKIMFREGTVRFWPALDSRDEAKKPQNFDKTDPSLIGSLVAFEDNGYFVDIRDLQENYLIIDTETNRYVDTFFMFAPEFRVRMDDETTTVRVDFSSWEEIRREYIEEIQDNRLFWYNPHTDTSNPVVWNGDGETEISTLNYYPLLSEPDFLDMVTVAQTKHSIIVRAGKGSRLSRMMRNMPEKVFENKKADQEEYEQEEQERIRSQRTVQADALARLAADRERRKKKRINWVDEVQLSPLDQDMDVDDED